MKAVLLSVRPQWCELIANGKKTIEVRKTRPKLDTPFKVYIYQTKPKDRLITILRDGDENYGEGYWSGRNQKVIGEFICDCILPIYPPFGNKTDGTCLSAPEMYQYAENKTLYGWHISALQIYDKPKELNEFHKPIMPTGLRYEDDAIKRPPQSWAYVEEYDGKR